MVSTVYALLTKPVLMPARVNETEMLGTPWFNGEKESKG